MKLRTKLLFVAVIGIASFPLYRLYGDQLQQLWVVPNEEQQANAPIDSVKESKSELDVVFTYLPFLGFSFQDVVDVDGSDLFARDGKRFSYQTNILEVYELSDSSSANALLAAAKEKGMIERTIAGKKQKFLAMTLRNYLCLVIEINDPVALKESYEAAVSTFQNLGIGFE